MKLFRAFTIAIASIIIFFFCIDRSESCVSYPEGEDIRFSAFQPDLGEATGFSPFYFSAHLFNESDVTDYDWSEIRVPTCDESTNIHEWKMYIKGNVSESAIDSVLYQTSPDAFVHTVSIYRRSEFLYSETLQHNKFVKWLMNNKEALSYMIYAKKIEDMEAPDPWTNEGKSSHIQRNMLFEEGMQKYRSVTDTFLKVRYAYQLVHLAGFESVEYYDSLMAPLETKSILKYWALSFKANALHDRNEHAEGNYLLSKVFENVEDKQLRARSGFNTKYVKDALKLAKNDHEKAVILIMKELRNPGRGLSSINEIYRLDPQCKDLDILLAREVNKVEDWLLTPEIMENDPAAGHNPTFHKYDENYNLLYSWVNRDTDRKYLGMLRDRIEAIAAEGKVRNPALWQVAAAYLSTMKDENSKALQLLGLAEKNKVMNAKIETQLHLTRALAAAGLLKKDKSYRAALEKELLWIDENWRIMYKPLRTMEHFMLSLSEKHLAAGDTLSAALLRSKASKCSDDREAWDYISYEFFAFMDEKGSASLMNRIVAYVNKKEKTAYESYLSREASAQMNMLYDLQGTWHLREDDLQGALAAYCNVPDSIWRSGEYKEYLNVNPFYMNINNAHRKTEHDSIAYTKPQMIEELIRLKNEAKKGGPGAGEKYFLIANAYYNMTWYGNSWMMTRSTWSYRADDGWRGGYYYLLPKVDKFYYGCTRAKQYYLEAIKHSSDRERSALCCLMAAVCDKNYNEYIYRKSDASPSQYKKYYVMLHDRYNDTHFYDQLILECPGVSKFIAMYRKL
jgi:hypothetical protein